MADTLTAALGQVAAKVKQYKTRAIGEQNTKQALIVPILRALDWDMEDLEEVRLEYKPKPAHNPVDYALLIMRTPRLFVEAKGLGENLQDAKWAGQIMGYATVAGVQWVVLTDGDEWQIYNSHAPVPVEEKLFRKVKISEDAEAALSVLGLLSKSQMTENAIDLQWKAHFIDRQVGTALHSLFAMLDPALIKLIRKKSPSVLPGEIKASLVRLRVSLDFPAEVSVVEPTPGKGALKFHVVTTASKALLPGQSAKPPKSGRAPVTWAHVTMADIIEKGLLKPGATIESHYKGDRRLGKVIGPGKIECMGTVYPTLSMAALASLHSMGATWKTVNGWDHWKCTAPDGSMVCLNDLRRAVKTGSVLFGA